MHERLFADDPPLNTRSGSFPRKILRHAEPFTFYSAPTKGELKRGDTQERKRKKEGEKEKEKEKKKEKEKEKEKETITF